MTECLTEHSEQIIIAGTITMMVEYMYLDVMFFNLSKKYQDLH